MAYLAKDDYTLRISLEYLDEVLATAANTSGLQPLNVLSNAESWGMATIKSYLTTNYNIAAEFGKTGTSRNFQIMQVLIDLVQCTIHKTINPRDVPEHVENSCKEAIAWLMDARDGKIVVDLPVTTNTDGTVNHNKTFLDSQQKFISKPYQDLSITQNNYPAGGLL